MLLFSIARIFTIVQTYLLMNYLWQLPVLYTFAANRAAKGEGWAPPFICCAQDTMGLLTPTSSTAIRLLETFTFTFIDMFALKKIRHMLQH